MLAAHTISVLVANETHASIDTPAGMIAALERAGRTIVIRRFELAGRDIGGAMLAEAHAVGADLLVMGAFTHLRLFEALFGGATRDLMAEANLPLLLHH